MKKHFLIIFVTIITISSISGCTHLIKKQIAENSNKTYHFTDFYYNHLGSTEEEVFKFMKEFPLKKVMFMIAHEHNINIDISEFQKFLLSDNQSAVSVKKGFRKEFFSWNSNSNFKNKITVHYKRDYFDQKSPEFKITLVINGKTYDLMDTEIQDNDHLIKRIAAYYHSAEKSAAEYDRQDYAKTSPVPGIIEYSVMAKQSTDESDNSNLTAADKKAEIEAALKNYVKNLDKEEKAAFRHEMLDLIYKITE